MGENSDTNDEVVIDCCLGGEASCAEVGLHGSLDSERKH